jgi:hypothetical protein
MRPQTKHAKYYDKGEVSSSELYNENSFHDSNPTIFEVAKLLESIRLKSCQEDIAYNTLNTCFYVVRDVKEKKYCGVNILILF